MVFNRELCTAFERVNIQAESSRIQRDIGAVEGDSTCIELCARLERKVTCETNQRCFIVVSEERIVGLIETESIFAADDVVGVAAVSCRQAFHRVGTVTCEHAVCDYQINAVTREGCFVGLGRRIEDTVVINRDNTVTEREHAVEGFTFHCGERNSALFDCERVCHTVVSVSETAFLKACRTRRDTDAHVVGCRQGRFFIRNTRNNTGCQIRAECEGVGVEVAAGERNDIARCEFSIVDSRRVHCHAAIVNCKVAVNGVALLCGIEVNVTRQSELLRHVVVSD